MTVLRRRGDLARPSRSAARATRERNRIFAEAFGKDPDFFAFYRSMQAYEAGLRHNDTRMVLQPDSEFFRYFVDPTRQAARRAPAPARSGAPRRPRRAGDAAARRMRGASARCRTSWSRSAWCSPSRALLFAAFPGAGQAGDGARAGDAGQRAAPGRDRVGRDRRAAGLAGARLSLIRRLAAEAAFPP